MKTFFVIPISTSIILFAAGAAMLYANPQSSRTVSWSDGTYAFTALTGTTQSKVLTFTSASEIRNANIFISPELSRILSTDLSGSVDSVTAQDPVSVRFRVVVPLGYPTGVYQGTVHVRSGSQSIPDILTVSISVIEPSSAVIPSEDSTPSPDRIVNRPDGSSIVRDELTVLLKVGTLNPTSVIQGIAKDTHGAITSSDSELLMYAIRYSVNDPLQLAPIRSVIKGYSEVDAVGTEPIGRPDLFPYRSANPLLPQPYSSWTTSDGNNWNLKYIHAPAAWDITTGDAAVPLAIIDIDIDCQHEDLKGNVVICPNSEARSNDFGHGTKVAGLAAAVGDNGFGVAGITWRASLRLYDIGADFSGSAPKTLARAMEQAVDDGARIVNISLSYVATTTDDFLNLPDWTKTLGRAVDYARLKQPNGVLWVFAAGNESQDASNTTPANLSLRYKDDSINDVITVGAITSASTSQYSMLAAYSNYGGAISVVAPGDGMETTVPPVCRWGNSLCGPDQYKEFGMTSGAAPQVAGLAALVLSQHKAFSSTQLRQCILNAAKAIGPPVVNWPSSLTITAPHVINAPAAVVCQPPTAGFLLTSQGQSATDGQTLNLNIPIGDTVSISMSITRSLAASPETIAGGEVSLDGKPVFSILANGAFTFSVGAGTHTVALIVTDSIGVPSLPVQAIVIAVIKTPPTAGFKMSSGSSSATEGQTLNLSIASGGSALVSFDASQRSAAYNGNTITGLQWTIDGSVVATTVTFSQSFAIGTHTVSLVVTDSLGSNSAPASGTVIVIGPTGPPSFSIIDLGTLAGGDTYATAINNLGQVIGSSRVNSNSSDAFVWTVANGMTVLGPLAGSPAPASSYANALNNVAIAVGSSASSAGTKAVQYKLTTPGTALDLGAGIAGDAKGVNDSGEVVGLSSGSFLWSSTGGYVNLDVKLSLTGTAIPWGINNAGQVIFAYSYPLVWTPGPGLGTLTALSYTWVGQPVAINNNGQIAGWDWPNVVRWTASDGAELVLGRLPGTQFGYPFAINVAGVVVGYCSVGNVVSSSPGLGDNSYIATLFAQGQIYDLNTLIPPGSGWTLREATGINDAGQIVGTGLHNGQLRAFLLTPQ
jgi:probable HAF family extracellular repeat protein